MFRYLFSIISLLIISPSVADIASSGYVDEVRDSVQAQIDKKAKNSNYTQGMVLQTDVSGNVVAGSAGTDLFADAVIQTMHLADGAVTNADLAGMIDITKLNLGTLPTSGKHVMIWNAETNEYVFEKLKESGGLQCDASAVGCRYDEWSEGEELICEHYPEYNIGFGQCTDPRIGANDRGYNSHDGTEKYNETKYNLSAGEWAAEFSYGTIKGIASCNNITGNTAGFTWSNSSAEWLRSGDTFSNSITGSNCWCKMTSPATSGWVFIYNRGSMSKCGNNCVTYCALNFRGNMPTFNSAVFGSVGK